MHEQVLAPVFGSDEAEALVGVEPLNCARWHVMPPRSCAGYAEEALGETTTPT